MYRWAWILYLTLGCTSHVNKQLYGKWYSVQPEQWSLYVRLRERHEASTSGLTHEALCRAFGFALKEARSPDSQPASGIRVGDQFPVQSAADLLYLDREVACFKATEERLAAEDRAQAERLARVARERLAAAEEEQRRLQAQAEEERRQEAARAERARIQREADEEAARRAKMCAGINTAGSFEASLTASTSGLQRDEAIQHIDIVGRAKDGLSECSNGNEFVRRRCEELRKAAHKDLRNTLGFVIVEAELGEYDFRSGTFPLVVPREAWAMPNGIDWTYGEDEANSVHPGMLPRSTREVRIKVSDLAEAEALRTGPVPKLVLQVRTQGFVRLQEPESRLVVALRQQMNQRLVRMGAKDRLTPSRQWRLSLQVVGIQVLNSTDGHVLHSEPPAIDQSLDTLATCAQTAGQEGLSPTLLAVGLRALAIISEGQEGIHEALGHLTRRGNQNAFDDKEGFDAKLNAAMVGTRAEPWAPSPALAEPAQKVEPVREDAAVIRKVSGGYTRDALRAGIEGKVIMDVTVGEDGRAKEPKLIQGLGYGLDEVALEAIGKWEFKPATLDGKPIKSAKRITIDFVIGD